MPLAPQPHSKNGLVDTEDPFFHLTPYKGGWIVVQGGEHIGHVKRLKAGWVVSPPYAAGRQRELLDRACRLLDDHARSRGAAVSESSDDAPPIVVEANQRYPRAGRVVDGLVVRDKVPNTDSIEGYFGDHWTLRHVRVVPMGDFTGSTYAAADDTARSKRLAEQIRESQEINPLIVGYEAAGPFIIEGGHRHAALDYLGKQAFPALVVVSLDEPPEGAAMQERSMTVARASTSDRIRWDDLHATQAMARAEYDELDRKLSLKYGSNYSQSWIGNGERDRLERLRARADKIGDKIVDLLVRISPRGEAWLSGVPAWWIREKLTWEDAVRPADEPLSVEVPLAWSATSRLTEARGGCVCGS